MSIESRLPTIDALRDLSFRLKTLAGDLEELAANLAIVPDEMAGGLIEAAHTAMSEFAPALTPKPTLIQKIRSALNL